MSAKRAFSPCGTDWVSACVGMGPSGEQVLRGRLPWRWRNVRWAAVARPADAGRIHWVVDAMCSAR
jgi:hypothetical protein